MGNLYTSLFDCIYLTHFFTIEVSKIKIDQEYNCNWWDECDYLLKHGIRYTFVKTINNITIWKFKKDAKLFQTLANFYKKVYYK